MTMKDAAIDQVSGLCMQDVFLTYATVLHSVTNSIIGEEATASSASILQLAPALYSDQFLIHRVTIMAKWLTYCSFSGVPTVLHLPLQLHQLTTQSVWPMGVTCKQTDTRLVYRVVDK